MFKINEGCIILWVYLYYYPITYLYHQKWGILIPPSTLQSSPFANLLLNILTTVPANYYTLPNLYNIVAFLAG